MANNINTLVSSYNGIKAGASVGSQTEEKKSLSQLNKAASIASGASREVQPVKISESTLNNTASYLSGARKTLSPSLDSEDSSSVISHNEDIYNRFIETVGPYVNMSENEKKYYYNMSGMIMKNGGDAESWAEDFLAKNAVANVLGVSRSSVEENMPQMMEYYLGVENERYLNFTTGATLINSIQQGIRQQEQASAQEALLDLYKKGHSDDSPDVRRMANVILQKDREMSYYQDSTPRKWWTEWGKSSLQQLPYMATGTVSGIIGNIIGGAASILVPGIGIGTGAKIGGDIARTLTYRKQFEASAFWNMKQAGVSTETALKYANIDGLINGLNEAFLDVGYSQVMGAAGKVLGIKDLGGKMIPNITSKIIKDGSLASFMGKFLLYMGLDASGEFVQESTQSLTSAALQAGAEYTDGLRTSWTTREQVKDAIAQAWDEGIQGFATGLFFGGATSAVSIAADYKTSTNLKNKAVKAFSEETYVKDRENRQAVQNLRLGGEELSEEQVDSLLSGLYKSTQNARNELKNNVRKEIFEQLKDIDGTLDETSILNRMVISNREILNENGEVISGKNTEVKTKEDGSLYFVVDKDTTKTGEGENTASYTMRIANPSVVGTSRLGELYVAAKVADVDNDPAYTNTEAINSLKTSPKSLAMEEAGRINFTLDEEKKTLTIDSVSVQEDSSTLKTKAVQELTAMYPEYTVEWENRTESDNAVYADIESANPRNTSQQTFGLNYNEKLSSDDADTAYVKRWLGTSFSDDSSENSFMATILQAAAKARGMDGKSFIEKYFTQIEESKDTDSNTKGYMSTKRDEATKQVKATIYAGKNADASTFMHELHHAIMLMGDNMKEFTSIYNRVKGTKQFTAFLQENIDLLKERIAKKDADGKFITDKKGRYSIDENKVNALFSNSNKWTENDFEFEARLYEAYVRNGRTFNPSLTGFFRRVAETFRQIYRNLRNGFFKTQLNDEVVAYFDKLYGYDASTGTTSSLNDSGNMQFLDDAVEKENSGEGVLKQKKEYDPNRYLETRQEILKRYTDPNLYTITNTPSGKVFAYKEYYEEYVQGRLNSDLKKKIEKNLRGGESLARLGYSVFILPEKIVISESERYDGKVPDSITEGHLAEFKELTSTTYSQFKKQLKDGMRKADIVYMLLSSDETIDSVGNRRSIFDSIKGQTAEKDKYNGKMVIISLDGKVLTAYEIKNGTPNEVPLTRLGDLPQPSYNIGAKDESVKSLKQTNLSSEEQYEAVMEEYYGTDKYMIAPNGKASNLTERQWIQTRTENFKQWFKDSKVVDENGDPLVVLHGSQVDWDAFDMNEARQNSDIVGAYFSSAEEEAETYGYGGYIREFYLSIQNPAPYDYAYDVFRSNQTKMNSGAITREALMAEGYDGVILREEGENDEYIVFSPNQIKSATDNNGDFSTESDSILHQSYNEEFSTSDEAQEELNKMIEKFGAPVIEEGKIRMNVSTVQELYALAEEAQPEFTSIINKLQSELGIEKGRVSSRENLKKNNRVLEKTVNDYARDIGRVLDVNGSTFTLANFADAESTYHKTLEALGEDKVANAKVCRTDSGYRDFKINIRTSNGFIGELIILDEATLWEKNEGLGHDIYEITRKLDSYVEDNETNQQKYKTLFGDKVWKIVKKLNDDLKAWSIKRYENAEALMKGQYALDGFTANLYAVSSDIQGLSALSLRNFESSYSESESAYTLPSEVSLNMDNSPDSSSLLYASSQISQYLNAIENNSSNPNVTQNVAEVNSFTEEELEAGDTTVLQQEVTDGELLRELEEGETIRVYRSMQLVDGKLYPPMAEFVQGKRQDATELGKWYRADERPDLAYEKKGQEGSGIFYFGLIKSKEKGKGTVEARYNPYWHTTSSPLNDQFKSAYQRPNLVIVEVEIPKSELTSGYKAEKAKDAVGEMNWHSGPVSTELAKLGDRRTVILSRYNKVVRILSNEEVAEKIAEKLDGTGIAIPDNVVPPPLLEELKKKGVKINETEEVAEYNKQKNMSLKQTTIEDAESNLSEKYREEFAESGNKQFATESEEVAIKEIVHSYPKHTVADGIQMIDGLLEDNHDMPMQKEFLTARLVRELTGEDLILLPRYMDRMLNRIAGYQRFDNYSLADGISAVTTKGKTYEFKFIGTIKRAISKLNMATSKADVGVVIVNSKDSLKRLDVSRFNGQGEAYIINVHDVNNIEVLEKNNTSTEWRLGRSDTKSQLKLNFSSSAISIVSELQKVNPEDQTSMDYAVYSASSDRENAVRQAEAESQRTIQEVAESGTRLYQIGDDEWTETARRIALEAGSLEDFFKLYRERIDSGDVELSDSNTSLLLSDIYDESRQTESYEDFEDYYNDYEGTDGIDEDGWTVEDVEESSPGDSSSGYTMPDEVPDWFDIDETESAESVVSDNGWTVEDVTEEESAPSTTSSSMPDEIPDWFDIDDDTVSSISDTAKTTEESIKAVEEAMTEVQKVVVDADLPKGLSLEKSRSLDTSVKARAVEFASILKGSKEETIKFLKALKEANDEFFYDHVVNASKEVVDEATYQMQQERKSAYDEFSNISKFIQNLIFNSKGSKYADSLNNLSDRAWKIVAGQVASNPEVYMDLYARAANNSEWAGDNSVEAKVIAELGLTKEEWNNASYYKRKMYAQDVADKELRNRIMSGKFVDSEVKEWIKRSEEKAEASLAEAKAIEESQKYTIDENKKTILKLNTEAQDAQKKISELKDEQAELQDRIDKAVTRMERKLKKNGTPTPTETAEHGELVKRMNELKRRQAQYEKALESYQNRYSTRTRDTKLTAATLSDVERIRALVDDARNKVMELQKKDVLTPEEALERLENLHAVWKDAKTKEAIDEVRKQYQQRLKDATVDKHDALKKARQRYMAEMKQRDALRKVRAEKERLARQIMKAPSSSVALEEAKEIRALQALVDPAYRRNTMKTIDGVTYSVEELKRILSSNPDDPVLRTFSERQLERLTKTSLNEMTLADVECFYHTILKLREQGIEKRRNEIVQRKAENRIIREGLMNELRANPKYEEYGFEGTEDRKKREKTKKNKIRDAWYNTLNMARKAQTLDNGEKGTFYNLLIRKKRLLENEEMKAVMERSKKIDDVIKDNKFNKDSLYKTWTVKFEDGRDVTFTTSELAYVYLSQNNEDNRDALAYGTFINVNERANIIAGAEKAIIGTGKNLVDARNNKIDGDIRALGDWRYNEVLSLAKTVVEGDKGLFKLVKAIESDFNDPSFSRVVNLVRKIYNVEVKKEDYYLPINRTDFLGKEPGEDIKNDLLNTVPGTKGSVSKGFTKERQVIAPRNQKAIRYDLFKVWTDSVKKQEHFVAMQEYVNQLNSIFEVSTTDTNVLREGIRNTYGETMLNDIDTHILEIADPNAGAVQSDPARDILKAAKGNIYSAYLGWKLSSITNQLITSPAAFFGKVGPIRYAKNLLQMTTSFNKTSEEVFKLSPFMKSRNFDLIAGEIKEAAEAVGMPKYKKVWNNFLEFGLKGLEWVDQYTVVAGWKAIYEQELERLGDNTEENIRKAVQIADEYTQETQPQSNKTELAPLYKNKNEMLNILLQFQTSLNVVWNNLAYDTVHNFKRKDFRTALGTMAGYATAGALLALAHGEFQPDDDDDDYSFWRAFLYSTVSQGIESIPVFSSYVDSIFGYVVNNEKPGYNTTSLTPFPMLASAFESGKYSIQAVKEKNTEALNKAIEKGADALMLGVGLPYSGINELKAIQERGIQAFIGAR